MKQIECSLRVILLCHMRDFQLPVWSVSILTLSKFYTLIHRPDLAQTANNASCV